MQFKKICVIGLGYIGLPTASTFATHGVQVLGVDIDPHVINTLRSGEIHIHEPGLRTLVQDALRSGNLAIGLSVEPADAFIIAVPTPILPDKSADMRAVVSAAESIVAHLRPGNLVVLESTSPPRTTMDLLIPILEQSGLKAGADFNLAYSPERVLPGQILRELVENARVIGGIDRASAEAGRDLYTAFVKGEIVETDATAAEMVKLMENTYRDVNIAIANEFARLADKFGVNIWEAIEIANRHPRVNILRPGPGVGGHCISVDPWFFVQTAPELTRLILASRQVNDSQPHFVYHMLNRILGGLAGKRVAALGLAYKPDVDDLRESPAIEVAHLLADAGAEVRAFEPFKPNANPSKVQMCASLEEALKDADVLLVLVAHSQFKAIQPRQVAKLTSTCVVLDTVHILDESEWKTAGFNFYYLGDGSAFNASGLQAG